MSDPARPGAPARPGRRRRWPTALMAVAATVLSASFGLAPARATTAGSVENWAAASSSFHQTTGLHPAVVVSVPGAEDGKALKLQLNARPAAGPRQGVTIASNNPAFRYGTFGTRMKTADCRGQDHPGVVTGTFVYAMDHSDTNRNGLPDNDEIDFEFLCGQPDVVWMALWTDYDEARDLPRQISRAVNLRTGQVLYNCYLVSWTTPCEPRLVGENVPATVTPVAGFNSATQFHTYSFDWQPNRVTFYASDAVGRRILLWDYRGPKSRIPQKSSTFMQNVWHTPTWDPFNGPSHNQPTETTSAYLDSTTLPRSRVSMAEFTNPSRLTPGRRRSPGANSRRR